MSVPRLTELELELLVRVGWSVGTWVVRPPDLGSQIICSYTLIDNKIIEMYSLSIVGEDIVNMTGLLSVCVKITKIYFLHCRLQTQVAVLYE